MTANRLQYRQRAAKVEIEKLRIGLKLAYQELKKHAEDRHHHTHSETMKKIEDALGGHTSRYG